MRTVTRGLVVLRARAKGRTRTRRIILGLGEVSIVVSYTNNFVSVESDENYMRIENGIGVWKYF